MNPRFLSLPVLVPLLAAFAPSAIAVALGEAELLSGLGQTLMVRIPYRAGPGESIQDSCITLAPNGAKSPDGIEYFSRARAVTAEKNGTHYITIASREVMHDPVVRVLMRLNCGPDLTMSREYTWLLDPPGENVAPIEVPVAAGEPSLAAVVKPDGAAASADAAAPGDGQTWTVGPGETLMDIAATFHPDSRRKQRALVRRIVAANPAVFAHVPANDIKAGTQLVIPRANPAGVPEPADAQRVTTARTAAKPLRRRPRASDESPAPGTATGAEGAAPQEDEARNADTADSTPVRHQDKARRHAPDRSGSTHGASSRGQAAAQPSYALKLSRGELDMEPTKTLSPQEREQLRERRIIMTADDQMAAFLELRDNVKRLENQLRDIQLRVAGMPAALPAPKPAPTAAAPATVPEEKVPAAAPPARVAVEPGPIAPAPGAIADPPAARVPGPPGKPRKNVIAGPLPARNAEDLLPPWLVRVLPVGLIVTLGGLYWSRRQRKQAEKDGLSAEFGIPDLQAHLGPKAERPVSPSPQPSLMATPGGTATGPARAAAEGVAPAGVKSTPEEEAALQQRAAYVAERFPEVSEGSIMLHDADSVVDGARIYYQKDGDPNRAVELLEYAISHDRFQIKVWLALFQILFETGRSPAFAALTERFREDYATSRYWPKVCALGARLDPANALYEGASPWNPDELDGPDENWLNTPLDFTPEVLADELREVLLSDFAIGPLEDVQEEALDEHEPRLHQDDPSAHEEVVEPYESTERAEPVLGADTAVEAGESSLDFDHADAGSTLSLTPMDKAAPELQRKSAGMA